MALKYYKPLLEFPDTEDLELHNKNCNTELVTARLKQLVPLLDFVGFNVDKMSPQKTILIVPLLESAMNQNGTQQAAVFYLIADYTLGVAIFSSLPGCYTVGVHDRCHAFPIVFWLKSGHVTHLRAGTGTIRAEISLQQEAVNCVRKALIKKGRYSLKGTIQIYQNEGLVAIAEHEMFISYSPYGKNESQSNRISLNTLDRHKMSALMIAGLRDDNLSRMIAGEQGIAIANRMAKIIWQLPLLIKSRTNSITSYLTNSNFSQVLVLGVGFDTKPNIFSRPDQIWYVCDLPQMLTERSIRFNTYTNNSDKYIKYISINLYMEEWIDKVIDAGFDPTKNTMVILEGVSMYIPSNDLNNVLKKLRKLFTYSNGLLWMDYVTKKVFDMRHKEVVGFLSSMARLGEPFITGFSDIKHDLPLTDWTIYRNENAAEILEMSQDVFNEYYFVTMAPT